MEVGRIDIDRCGKKREADGQEGFEQDVQG
jgi:hypothetical protein